MSPLEAVTAYVVELWTYAQVRYRCWRTQHDLSVYVSPFTELPGLLSCRCKKVHRAIDIVPLSDLE